MKKSVFAVLIIGFSTFTATNVQATTVCFDTLAGKKCVEFRTPPPKAPKTSKNLTIALDADRIVSGGSIVATAKKFTRGEYVRAFVFNVYGRQAASELSGGAIADNQGVATINYGTNSLPVSVSETRTICLRGERSKLMACASFQFEG
jgi:hypothetical protein